MYRSHHDSTGHPPVARAPAPVRRGIRLGRSAAAKRRFLGRALLAAALAGGLVPGLPSGPATAVAASPTYEVKFRVKGIVSTTTVQARDAAQAKKLVMAQYAGEATVLSVKRLR